MGNILGVRIDEVTKDEALKKCEDFLNSGERHLVFTPNPEIVVKAQNDKMFLDVLNRSSLSLCDGFGLYLALRLKGQKTSRIPGVDFMLDLCALAEKRGERVFLLGSGNEDVVKKTKNILVEKFPKLNVVGVNAGPKVGEKETGISVSSENESVTSEIDGLKPSILFVAFGMGKQEKWLNEFGQKLPSMKIGMVVGGAFDFISGNVPRAPLLLREFGLEWAYRLFKQPQRIKRILNATIKFSFLFISDFF